MSFYFRTNDGRTGTIAGFSTTDDFYLIRFDEGFTDDFGFSESIFHEIETKDWTISTTRPTAAEEETISSTGDKDMQFRKNLIGLEFEIL
jgi:hypothetical protein